MPTQNAIAERYSSHQLDNENKGALIENYYSLIKYVAQRLHRIFPQHIDLDILIQAGVIGFIRAVDHYDVDRGAKFTTFATICIKGAILEELRSMDWATRSVRQKANKIEKALEYLEKKNITNPTDEDISKQIGIPVAKYYDMLSEVNAASVLSLDEIGIKKNSFEKLSLLDIIKNFDDPDPETKIIFKERQKILGKMIESLSEKERLVITLYYFEELTMKEIGKVLDITESRISQLHNSAIIKLRVKLNKFEKEDNDNIIPLSINTKSPEKQKISWLLYGIFFSFLFFQLLGCGPKKQVKIDNSPRDWQVMVFPLNYVSPNTEISNQIANLLSEELSQKWRNVINYKYSTQALYANKNNGLAIQNTVNELYINNGLIDPIMAESLFPPQVKAIIIVDVFSYSHFWNEYKKMIKIGLKVKIFNIKNCSPIWENVVLENFKEEQGGIEQATREAISKIVNLIDYQEINDAIKRRNS
ncbi:MAG: FliA/WhiG family RNA polymerase sigma factor [Candidatus Firestonebacteria bacterium]|nr:FliA/WhiG family RNA polymerase sigma factor [Candidatus Firestonebacteria bacterium]